MIVNVEVYRHDWGRHRGTGTLHLTNWPEINGGSFVLASICEHLPYGRSAGGVQADRFVGAAVMSIHNIVPGDGYVDVVVEVDWNTPLPIYVDYFRFY